MQCDVVGRCLAQPLHRTMGMRWLGTPIAQLSLVAGSVCANVCFDLLVARIAQESFRLYNRHIALMVEYNCYLPKHHMMYHLIGSLAANGNPDWYSNWVDETLNKTLKATCRHVSQQTFEASVLLRMRELLAVGTLSAAKAAKRRRK